MNQFVIIALLFVATFATFSSAQRYREYDYGGGYGGGSDRDYVSYDDQADYPISRSTAHQTTARYIKKFQKTYCANAPGNYRKCRTCVAIGCLRYMEGDDQGSRYDNCIEEHNRCCTANGSGRNTAGLSIKCYATGFISEVGGGQLSVVQTLTGEQSPKAPKSFSGTNN